MTNSSYTKQQLATSFKQAVAYVDRYFGYEVQVAPASSFDAGYVDFRRRKIKIPQLRSKFTMYATLLHEIGHLIRHRQEESAAVQSRSLVLQTHSRTSKMCKLAILQEEFEAWDEGLALAIRKGWVMDTVAFNRSRTKCLQSYVVWCCQVPTKTSQIKAPESTQIFSYGTHSRNTDRKRDIVHCE